MDRDRHQMIREQAWETGLAHTSAVHILKERQDMTKNASWFATHNLTNMQKWLRHDTAKTHLKRNEWEERSYMPYQYAWWDLMLMVPAKTKTPIKRMTSLRIITNFEFPWEPQKYECHGDSRTRLWCCHPNAYFSPTTNHQCAILLLIFGAPSQTSIGFFPFFLREKRKKKTSTFSQSFTVRNFWYFELIPKMKLEIHGIRLQTVWEIHATTDQSNRIINKVCAASGVQRLPYRLK